MPYPFHFAVNELNCALIDALAEAQYTRWDNSEALPSFRASAETGSLSSN